MKKKLIAILLTLCLALSLVACASGEGGASSSAPAPSAAENSETAEGSPAPEETETTPPEESGDEEETTEGAVPEDVLNNYGLSAEEFEALRAAISTQIQEEWVADEAYDSNLNGLNNWIGPGAAAAWIGSDGEGTFITGEAMDEYIEKTAKYFTEQDPLLQERAMVLGHALSRWAADNGVSHDKWEDVWSGLQVAFWEYCYEEDPNDKWLKPLFSPEN